MRLKVTYYKSFATSVMLAGGLSAFASSASAACISSGSVYCDTTLVQAYHGNGPTNWGGPGFVPPGVGDVLQDPGHNFDTDRVDATITSNSGKTTLDLKFYTSFNGNDETARYADIFLGSHASSPGTFNYAITVGDEAANNGLNTVGLYDLPGTSSYETSAQIWGTKTSFIYGGEFEAEDSQFYLAPTVVTAAADPDSRGAATVTEGSSGDPDFPYLVDVSLTTTTQDFDLLFGSGLSVFWGTGDCSNDAIEAFVSNVNVAEPVTASMLAIGFGGLFFARRRKKSFR